MYEPGTHLLGHCGAYSGSQKGPISELSGGGCRAHTFLFFNIFLFCQKFLQHLFKSQLLTMGQHHTTSNSLIFQVFSPRYDFFFCLHFWNLDKEKTQLFTSLKVFVAFVSTKVCWKLKKQSKQTLNFILH